MSYISATKGGIISIIFFALITWLLPGPSERPEGIDVILTISTFLFAILTGFFISRMNTRYDELRDSISQEDALWLSLYEYADYFDQKFTNKVRILIDQYYLIAYDYELGAYYKKNAHVVAELYEVFEKTHLNRGAAAKVYDDAVAVLVQIETQRNRSSVLWKEGMTMGQWSIVLLLGVIMILSFYFYGVYSFLFKSLTVLLSGVVVITILTLRDLEQMRLGGKLAVEESGEEVLEAIGMPRYYNQFYVKQNVVSIPSSVKEYRLGRHKPGEPTDIVLVKNKKFA